MAQFFSYPDTYLPGRYELRFDQSAIPQPVYYGVGINQSELDDTMLSDDDRKWLSGDDHRFVQGHLEAGKSLTAALGGSGSNLDWIWPLVACFVLATLLGETFLTYKNDPQAGQAGRGCDPGRTSMAVA